MTKAQQVIKVFAYILAIVIIINIFTAIINIIGSVVDFSGTKDRVHYEEVYENINNIKPKKGRIYKQKVVQKNKENKIIAIYTSAAEASR